MVSEDKLVVFLNLQQIVLDIEEGTKLLELFLPQALDKLISVGYPYIFLSAVFIDSEGKINQTFFTDKTNSSIKEAMKEENLFQRGSEWEMKVMYGEAAVVSNIDYFINSSYLQISQIHSMLILPVQQRRKLTGVLVLGRGKNAEQIDSEEIEFGMMITRLIDLAFRLEDTERSLTKITKQVYEMNAKLHQLDKLKDDFVSIASHELRTPMTAIRSYVWMALHKPDIPLSQKLERYLYRTLVSTERLINLVNDMLNVSRIESGSIEIDPKSFDMVTLVGDTMEEMHAKADEKEVKLLVLESQIPKVFADENKVHEILLNLIGNAVKFTLPGGTVSVSFFSDGKVVETSVKDSGVGIIKDDLNKLFSKFSRLDNSYVSISTSGGTGLGLYISRSLVKLMHGTIRANSEGTGKGSTFTFSLPVATKEVIENANIYKVMPRSLVKELEPVAI
ncbi:HAMP domain-containing histidine kinase [Candidatus Daviesbacteria bacterium]|nr:HAMP domain-containing histidine kinase [Candidatus Daviesbacteria bacterium]